MSSAVLLPIRLFSIQFVGFAFADRQDTQPLRPSKGAIFVAFLELLIKIHLPLHLPAAISNATCPRWA